MAWEDSGSDLALLLIMDPDGPVLTTFFEKYIRSAGFNCFFESISGQPVLTAFLKVDPVSQF
jgi:hypothetical protein